MHTHTQQGRKIRGSASGRSIAPLDLGPAHCFAKTDFLAKKEALRIQHPSPRALGARVPGFSPGECYTHKNPGTARLCNIMQKRCSVTQQYALMSPVPQRAGLRIGVGKSLAPGASASSPPGAHCGPEKAAALTSRVSNLVLQKQKSCACKKWYSTLTVRHAFFVLKSVFSFELG